MWPIGLIVMLPLVLVAFGALPDQLVSKKEQKRRIKIKQEANRADPNLPGPAVIPPPPIAPIGTYVIGVRDYTIDERYVTLLTTYFSQKSWS